MLRKLWRRRRHYSTAEEQMWVKYFTEEPNVRELSTVPGVDDALRANSSPTVSQAELNDSLDTPNSEFLPKLFRCDVPVTAEDAQFVLLFTKRTNEKELDAAAPVVFRFAIRYVYNFGNDVREIMREANEDVATRLRLWAPLAKVLSAMPGKYQDDASSLKQQVFATLATNEADAMGIPLFDEIAAECAENAQTMAMTEKDIPELVYFVQYFWCWVHTSKLQEGTSNEVRARTCLKILDVLVKLDKSVFAQMPPELLERFVKSSIPRLEACFVDELDPALWIKYGDRVLAVLKLIASVNVNFMRLVLNNESMNSIAYFVGWIVDRFPIVFFGCSGNVGEEELALFSEDEDSALKGQVRRMEFCGVQTFEKPVPAPTLCGHIEDKRRFEAQYGRAVVPEKLEESVALKTIAARIGDLSKFPESVDFVKTVIGSLFEFAEGVLKETNEKPVRIRSSEEIVASSMLLFLVTVLEQIDERVRYAAMMRINGFQRLLSSFVFSREFILWQPTEEFEDLAFYAIVRKAVFGFIGRSFLSGGDVAVLCLEVFEFFFVVATPEMGDEAVSFLCDLFRADPALFRDALTKTRVLECLVDFSFMLEVKNIQMVQNGVDPKYVHYINQSRLGLFHLWDLLSQYKPLLSFCLMNACFVKFMFTQLCEPGVQRYAIELIVRSFMLKSDEEGQCALLFGEMDKLFQESHVHKNEQEWIDLLVTFIDKLPKVFACNRQLLPYIRQWKWMIAASELVTNADDLKQAQRLVNVVLRSFRPITTGNLFFRKAVAQQPMKNICARLENQPFEGRTIDLLLELVFECDFSMKNPPKMAEIGNQKILSYLHTATKHLPEHHQIFTYISRICMPSVLNKLKVFKSNMLIHCLRYIRTFESDLDCSDQQRSSVNALLNLFSIVSSFVFHWKTFFEAISMMKPVRPGYRPWWTSQLISTFTNILSSSSEIHAPSSFFHFDGRGTALILPSTMNSTAFEGGFTFLTKFELGTVIGRSDRFCSLLWLEVQNGPTVAVLLSSERKLIVHYHKNERKATPTVLKSEFRFGANQWYTLAVTFDTRSCSAYVNGEQILSGQINDFRIPRSKARGFIANSAKMDMPLKFNMSCCYLFSGSLSSDVIRLIATLPVDFVYSFAPSSWSLFPEIEGREYSALFSGSLAAKEIVCYNARMTIDSVLAANVARNGVGSAQIRAEVIPFSTTFCDVSYNIGGLKTFLPVFQQVDYQVEKEEHNDAGSFMLALSGLFAQFCRCSADIQRDFITCGGMKCLSHLFSKVKSESFQNAVILQMDDLYSRLEQDNLKMAMMEDFWLNFNLWHKHSPSHQVTMINKFLVKEVQTGNTLLKMAGVAFFLMLCIDEPSVEVRGRLWELIVEIGRIRLTPFDRELMFAAALCSQSTEVLGHVLFFLQNKINNFQKVVESNGVYTQFIRLMSVRDEEIVVMGFRYLMQLRELEASGAIQNSNSFDDAILSVIKVFCPENKTTAFWTACISWFFGNQAIQAAYFPFMCFLSHFYDQDLVLQTFIGRWNTLLVPFVALECESMVQCHAWYFWLFYAYLQMSRPQVHFQDAPGPITSIFAKVLVTLLWKGNFDGFRRALGFLVGVMVMRRWNLTVFIRDILIETTEFAKELNSENVASFYLWEVVQFLFYIPNIEMYSKSVELYGKHGVDLADELCSVCQGNTKLGDLVNTYLNFSIEDLSSVNFTGRIDAAGKWQDLELAWAVVQYICNLNVKWRPGAVLPNRLKVMDVVAFLLGYVIRNDPSKIELCCGLFDKLPVQSLNVSFMIFFVQLYHATRVNGKAYDAFCKKYASIVGPFAQPGQPLVFDHPQCIDYIKDYVPAFYASMNDQCAVVIGELRDCIMKATSEVIGRLNKMVDPQVDPGISALWERERIKYNLRLQRQKTVCEKAYKRIFRELSTNGGPWCSSKREQHWRMWQVCDSAYRRVFLKPNTQFDLHKDASFRRDESSAQEARQKYERWLQDTQLEADENEELQYKEESEERKGDYEFSTEAQLVTIKKTYTGTFYMNSREIWFNDPENKSIQFYTSELEMVLHRSYLHIDKGLEFFLTSKRSFFLYFPKGDRQKIIRTLRYLALPSLSLLQTSSSNNFISSFTERWADGQLSNYEYLMYVNFLGGRSFNDLSQYPVFPWVICDYESKELDLNNPAVYRDLSKPIGTLNERRLENLRMNFEQCPDDIPEKCFYRMHYSNAFYVLHWLVRLEPYTTLHIEVNDKRFDKPNRMFWSIPKSWEAVTSLNPDFRELIPEFFTLPEFLLNSNKFDLGFNPDADVKLDDVVLPPWAADAHAFIDINRQALESPYVSQHLNEWIDLMFGFKQQGVEAVRAQNTFHQYCYQSCITNEILHDPDMLMTIQTQASNVGIIPRQLFTSPHPCKRSFDLMPVFSLAKIDCLFKLRFDPRYILMSDYVLYALGNDCVLRSMVLPRGLAGATRIQATSIGSIEKFLIMPPGTTSLSKSFAFVPDLNRLVTSSLFDNTFHVFRMSANEVVHVESFRQKFSLLSTLNYAGGSYVLASWRDSSLTLWDLSSRSPQPLYRATPHLTSLVDVDVDPKIELIASLDKDRNCMVSMLMTGKLVRRFAVEGTDPLQKVFLFSTGMIAVLSAAELPRHDTTITIYGIDSRKIAELHFTEAVREWAKAEFMSGLAGIAVAFEGGRFVFLALPECKPVLELMTGKTINFISFVPQAHSFLVVGADRNVYTVIVG